MLGYDNRTSTSFKDAVGRAWEWKFIPKDMPGSEWSIQKTVVLRLEQWEHQFKRQVMVKQDLVLVMAKDEAQLRRYVLAVVFALQTKPWRLEVDFWKSFVNVEVGFLEGLDKAWVE